MKVRLSSIFQPLITSAFGLNANYPKLKEFSSTFYKAYSGYFNSTLWYSLFNFNIEEHCFRFKKPNEVLGQKII